MHLSPSELVEQILECPNYAAQRACLRKHLAGLSGKEAEEIAEALKEKVVEFMWGNTSQAMDIANLILDLAAHTENDLHRALGLRAKAQTLMVGKGDYQGALAYYDEAITLHRSNQDILGEALAQMTRIWALANLGRYEEAVEKGLWAGKALEDCGRLRDLASLFNNLALVHNRVGRYSQALEMFTEAGDVYAQLGEDGARFLPGNQYNRAMALCNMGEFETSIQASHAALKLAEEFKQETSIARAQHNLGLTYSIMGRFTDALLLFSQARETHLGNEQLHEAALCDLSSMFCSLKLRRFNDVLEKGEQVRELFVDLGMRLEAAETLKNHAEALSGTERYEDAVASLMDARQLFVAEGHQLRIVHTDLEIAALYFRQGDFAQSLTIAEQCIVILDEMGLLFWAAQARLVAASAALVQNQLRRTRTLIDEAIAPSEQQDWPFLLYQGYHLRGQLARVADDGETALACFEQAVNELERLRAQLMVEFRADFLEDKQVIYERIVDLCLSSKQFEQGLQYAERAKSRALLELLTFRMDLGIQAHEAADEPVVEEIKQLRSTRQQRLKYFESVVREGRQADQALALQLQSEILAFEKQITELWHRLLVRNADYARDVSLWEVHTEQAQPYLDADALLIEYFVVGDEIVVFLVNAGTSPDGESVRAFRLSAKMLEVEGLLQRFSVNINMLSRSASHFGSLLENAQGILKRLNNLLLAPFREILSNYAKLIIVPHGALHYLPFHALYDGETYLIQTHQVSYLPASSFMRHCREAKIAPRGLLAVGHSYNGHLPHAVEEAKIVADLWGEQPLLEEAATLRELQGKFSQYRILHLACHGDFRADNPLFSGLAFENDWLTTLDIFNLRLRASLVTLSACQTGRSVIGGGDELLGLMRAFISAGAASIVLSLWPVADDSSARLMEFFYRRLAEGDTKGAALRAAQCQMLAATTEQSEIFQHPYFWAPFFLVGSDGLV